MKATTKKIYEELFARYSSLRFFENYVKEAFQIICTTYENGGTLYLAGNGGSASDCEHIVGELLKSFKKHRPVDAKTAEGLKALGKEGEYLRRHLEGALPAVSLISQTSIITAFANDNSWETAIAQQLYGLGRCDDCLLMLSTSGNSENCVYAALLAKVKGIKTIALTGAEGGRLKEICDVCVCVPETETYKVQELHLPFYHCLCAMLEEELFD